MPGRVSPISESKNIFGPQLKKLRLARKITATKVIAQLGVLGWEVGHSTFSSLEAGNRILADTELALVLRVLKADLTDLRLPRQQR
ncbi:MAG TPA: helix-turn-helix transcriptional regulator [Chthoniobacterales bacterium]|nr:helix-turn-helix transcriptional regulator [Chthoniobacterales bacterium]